MIPVPQYENYLVSSAFLWLDHIILDKTKSFTNLNVNFYPIHSPYNNIRSYASPFEQFVSDSSIAGAVIPTGVYINNLFTPIGVSGLYHIDYNNARVYITGNYSINSISGQFAVKYFNIKTIDEPEEKILVENSYRIRPKTTIQATGLQENENNYPIIFLKSDGGYNEPAAFGGMDSTNIRLKLIILTDSMYSLNSINSVIRDTCKTDIPIFNSGQMPFNIFGNFISGSYNYTNIANSIKQEGNTAYIDEVYVSKYNQAYNDLRKINPKIYWSIIDIETQKHRYPRL